MARGKKKESALTPEEKLAQALVPVDEQPYRVPENWCWAHWGNCGEFTAGNGFKNEYQGFQDLPIPFYKVGSLKYSDSSGYLYDASNTIDEEIRGKLKATIIPVNSVIFAKIGEAIRLNRRSLNAVPCCIDNNLMAFIANGSCLYSYAFYWSKGTELYDFTNATTVPAIRKSDLEMIPFPLPPLAEQQRIVDRIEYLFAKLDEAKEKAQSVLDSFETRKAAILHKAFTGELTAKWRLEHGISDNSWSTVDITRIAKTGKDALKAGPFGSALKKSMYVPEGYKIYGQEQVIAGDETIGDYYIDENKYQELISCKIAPHDILISLVGTVGKVLVLSDTCKPGIINPRLIKVSLNERIMIPYFFKYYFESDSLKEKYKGESHGITMDVLNMRILKMLPFPLCTLDEQTEIVRILDSLIDKEQKAKEAAEAMLEKIDLLKKSILARAFRGELGTNDPAEESALELLKSVL